MNSNWEFSSMLETLFPKKNENPFVGLRPFESEEGHLFFGRDKQLKDLLQKLHNSHFLAIVGSSGCGKSSLIRAGVIPKLKGGFLTADRDHWLVATMRPSGNPLKYLAQSISDALQPLQGRIPTRPVINDFTPESIMEMGKSGLLAHLHAAFEGSRYNLLILVDQFEELFTYKADTEAKKNENIFFADLLLGLANEPGFPVYTIITMRSDFIGHCNRFLGLPELLNNAQYLVPRLKWQQIREVIEFPIKLYGQQINPGLLDLLSNDSDKELDQLPVLQHCLMRTYQNWMSDGRKGLIEFKHYKDTGKLTGAICKHADEIYNELDAKQKKILEYLFRAITDFNADYEPARRPQQFVKIVQICKAVNGATKEDILDVINKFRGKSCAFLTPFETVKDISDETVIDISHESLMRQWDILKDWMKDEQRSADKLYWLSECVLGDKEYLRGLDIKDALAWKEKQRPNNAWAVRYVDNLPAVLIYISNSITSYKKRKWIINGSLFFGIAGILTAILLFSITKVESAKSKAKSDFEQAQTQAEAKLKIKQTQTQAEADFKIKQAQTQADADFKIKQAQTQAEAHANAMIKIKEAEAEASRKALPEAITRVLALTNEKFYQLSYLDTSEKNKSVLELIRLKYTDKNEIGYQNMLSALNMAAKGQETVETDPNIGLWMVKQAYEKYPYPIFRNIFQELQRKYLFYTKKNIIPYSDYNYSFNKGLLAFSKQGGLFAYPDYDSIRVGVIEHGNTYIKSSFTIPNEFLYNANINLLSFSANNDLVALVNDSIIFHWKESGEQTGRRAIDDTYGYVIRKFSPDGKRLFLGSKDSLKIVNVDQNEVGYMNIGIDKVWGKLTGIVISPASTGCIVIQENGYSIYDFDKSVPLYTNSKKNIAFTYTPDGNNLIEISGVDAEKHVYLSDRNGDKNDSATILIPLLYGQTIGAVDVSPNIKTLLISVKDVYASYQSSGYQSAGAELFFIIDTPFAGKYKTRLTTKKIPQATWADFYNGVLLALEEIGKKLSIEIMESYDNLKITDGDDPMPPLSFTDKIRVGITDINKVYDTTSLSVAAKSMTERYSKTYDSNDLGLIYTIYYRLMQIDEAAYLIKFRNISRERFLYYDRDTIRYCNDLRRILPLEEILLASGNLNEDLDELVTSTDYGRLSFYSMFNKNISYDSVIRYAKRGLEHDSVENNWIYTNLALGYLFSGQTKKAYRIYERFKDSSYSQLRNLFKTGFLEDLEKLENAGLLNSNKPELYLAVKKIRKFLNGEIPSLE